MSPPAPRAGIADAAFRPAVLDALPAGNGFGRQNESLGWRMAVLPFRSIGAPIGRGIALGMAEEISASLARYRAPHLLATATFWDGAGPAEDALDRCRAYQLDYIIDGTIQVIENDVRVTVTLLDVVLEFEVIWTSRFDGTMDNLFYLQDRIAAETVGQVDPELFQGGWEASAPAKTRVPGAHHLVLAAIQAIFGLEQAKFMRARDLLLRAAELDPEYAAAYAWTAYWSIMAVGQGWVEAPRDVTALAGAAAERALALDPLDARAVAVAGHVKGYLLHDVASAVALHAKAIELNPSLPIAWTLSSWSKIYSGDHLSAIKHAQMSKSLSPQDPHIFFVEHALMTAHFFQKQLDDAEMMAQIVLKRNPSHASALNVQLAILGHMGRRQEAAANLAELRRIEPNITIDRIVARPPLRPWDRDFYVDGLRRAGVPD